MEEENNYSSWEFCCDVLDVDIISAINNIESNLKLSKIIETKNGITSDEYIQKLWESVSVYCEEKGLAFDDEIKLRKLIVDSAENFYTFAISVDLMQRPLHKIESFLNYQHKNFKGNSYAAKDKFVVMIEKLVENIVDRSPVKDQERLDRIENWVQKKKNQDLNDDGDVDEPNFAFAFSSEQRKDFSDAFKSFFKADQWDSLTNLISNKDRGCIAKLNFDGSQSTLVELFKRLKYHDYVECKDYNQMAVWIGDNFTYKGKIKDKKEVKDIKYTGALNVLQHPGKEPSLKNIILVDLYPYLAPNKR